MSEQRATMVLLWCGASNSFFEYSADECVKSRPGNCEVFFISLTMGLDGRVFECPSLHVLAYASQAEDI